MIVILKQTLLQRKHIQDFCLLAKKSYQLAEKPTKVTSILYSDNHFLNTYGGGDLIN